MEEVSHKDIYDRLVAVESKVDKIDEHTTGSCLSVSKRQGCVYRIRLSG
jgi:hypothetical protein